jgi:hypothetical protein
VHRNCERQRRSHSGYRSLVRNPASQVARENARSCCVGHASSGCAFSTFADRLGDEDQDDSLKQLPS